MEQARIDALDLAWRAEIGSAATPTIDPVLQSAAAEFLRSRVDASGGRITEVFIMDQHGLNVAASAMTSDMWQGDEAKFTETYSVGPVPCISAMWNSTNPRSGIRRRFRSPSSIRLRVNPLAP
jgi:hypothetical protein